MTVSPRTQKVHQCYIKVWLLQPLIVSNQPNVTSNACLIRLLPLSPLPAGLLGVIHIYVTPPAAARPTCGRVANTPAALNWWALTSYSHSWCCCSQASDSHAKSWGGNSSVIENRVKSRRFLCHPTNWLCFADPKERHCCNRFSCVIIYTVV